MDNIFTNRRFSWHDSKVTLPDGFDKETTPLFNVQVPISNSWDNKEQRLLIIQEHVDSTDLKERVLCSDFYGQLLTNLLYQAVTYAGLTTGGVSLQSYGVAVVNFSAFKSYHLDSKRQTIADRTFARRVEKMMAMLKPTHVIVLGDKAAHLILQDQHYRETRGWVREYTRDWGKFAAVSAIDPADLISVGNAASDAALDDDADSDDDEGGRDLYAKTNLLGQVFRDMSNIFSWGKTEDPHGLQFSIAGYDEARHILLTDMDKVRRLFSLLMDAPLVSFDTETDNLNRIANKLLTLQFSMGTDKAFIIPYMHRQSPFTKAEKEEIRELTYKLFCNPQVDPFGQDRYLIGTNLQFDLTQTREQMKIPIITWPLFDIQNADFILDENLSELDNFRGTTPAAWSLAAITTRYGSNAYLDKEGFNKSDRANMAATDLGDKSVIEYMGLDCTVPYAIHEQQIARARATGYKKFLGMVLGQQSNNSHTASVMEHKGVHIDQPYLVKQLKKGSELHAILQDAKDQLADTEGALAANAMLAEARGVDMSGGLFSDMEGDDGEAIGSVQIFNIDKPEHRQVLFRDVMDLQPVSGLGKLVRKTTGQFPMKLDKLWQSEHREVYEVSLYTRINKVAKLISSYVKSFYEKVVESDDGKIDGMLRPSYGFLYVKTGRGNSFKPSLQQTPTRSKEAKYVKRMFAVPFGFLKLKTDYSANEVRFAANIAGDEVMAAPFNVARDLRTKMFWASVNGLTEKVGELAKELKQKGDIHIQNVFRFFKKWVAKDDPLRDAIKGVVFGVIYGKSAGTLGRDMWSQKVNELKDLVWDLKKQLRDDVVLAKAAKDAGKTVKEFGSEMRHKLNELTAELDTILADKTRMKGRAEEVMVKMKAEWKKLYKWMASMHQSAADNLYVEAPHGRRRNLYGMMVPRNDIQAALERRAVNAPVQGFGADVGHTSARILDLELHRFLRKFKLMDRNATTVPASVECAVHDALLQTCPYRLIMPVLQILNHCMTTGVANWFASYFGHEWLSPPEVETDIGMHEASMLTWNYRFRTPDDLKPGDKDSSLEGCIRHGLKTQYDEGLFPKDVAVEDIVEEIFDVPEEWQTYLDERFPWFDKPDYQKKAA